MGDLLTVLERSRELGFLGPGAVESHILHAERFAAAYDGAAPARALDLGSGGGVPGLVLAGNWPGSEWWLLDASERRTAFLEGAIQALGLADRVWVRRGRAEEFARDDSLRHQMDLVTARSFGPPAVTAECATGFLRVGGQLIVSEPPEPDGRWDEQGLAILGMEVGPARSGCQILRQVAACPEHYPRRVGIPAKRPLF